MADDHAIFRDGLRKLIDGDEDITIVGEAQNGAECIKLLAKPCNSASLLRCFNCTASDRNSSTSSCHPTDKDPFAVVPCSRTVHGFFPLLSESAPLPFAGAVTPFTPRCD